VADDERRIREPGPGRAGPATPVVQLGSPGRGPFLLATLTAAFLLVAIIKPWPGSSGPSVEPIHASPTPTAAASADPLAVVRRACQDPPGWRPNTKERWSGGTLHVWVTVQPAEGHHAPIEDGLPTVPYATEVLALGFCTPYGTDGRPPDGASVHVWRIDEGGAAGFPTRRAELLTVAPEVGGLARPYGALFGPPVSDPRAVPDRWTPARYVFEVVGPGNGYDRWWAVEIDPPLHPLVAPSAAPGSQPVP
jgi:hypothetical protein